MTTFFCAACQAPIVDDQASAAPQRCPICGRSSADGGQRNESEPPKPSVAGGSLASGAEGVTLPNRRAKWVLGAAVVSLVVGVFSYDSVIDALDKRRLAELRGRNAALKASLNAAQIRLGPDRPVGVTVPSSIFFPPYRDDPEYRALFAELRAVAEEYNTLVSQHPEWGVLWLSMDLHDVPQ